MLAKAIITGIISIIMTEPDISDFESLANKSVDIRIFLTQKQGVKINKQVEEEIQRFDDGENLLQTRTAMVQAAQKAKADELWDIDEEDISVASDLFQEVIDEFDKHRAYEGRILDIAEYEVPIKVGIEYASAEFDASALHMGELVMGAIHRGTGNIIAIQSIFEAAPTEEEVPKFEIGFIFDPSKDVQQTRAKIDHYEDDSIPVDRLARCILGLS